MFARTAHSFARFALLTHLLASYRSLIRLLCTTRFALITLLTRSAALIRLLVSLTHFLTHGIVYDSMSQSDLILPHSGTAQEIKELTLIANPVTEIEGLEKLGAVEEVCWMHHERCDFLPRWIEALSVETVQIAESSVKELPAWLFRIPTIKEITAWTVVQMETVDLGPNPSATLTSLTIKWSAIKSLPDNLFAHALEEVDVSVNKGKEKSRRRRSRARKK